MPVVSKKWHFYTLLLFSLRTTEPEQVRYTAAPVSVDFASTSWLNEGKTKVSFLPQIKTFVCKPCDESP